MGYFLQFHLESIGNQEKLLDYQLTIFFLYLYFRIVLHAITHQVLKSTSPIYANMPDGLQRDYAFMCVDGPSFFMWMPLTLYLVVVILHEQNLQAVSMRVGPLLYVGSVAYQLDRLFHLFNVFRVDRLIHHSLTCIWMLLVLEWTPESFLDYSIVSLLLRFYSLQATGNTCRDPERAHTTEKKDRIYSSAAASPEPLAGPASTRWADTRPTALASFRCGGAAALW